MQTRSASAPATHFATSLRRYIAECVGTFLLVAIGPGAAMVAARTHAFGDAGVAAAFGLAVALIVAATGHLGGAHINPAVTLGCWSLRRLSARDVLPYIVAQCVGAVAAAALLGWLLGSENGFAATVPMLPIAQSFVVEMGYTGVLGFVVMAVATDERTPLAVAPFALGITIAAGALVTGPLAGGSFNPARSLGSAVMGNVWTAHWLYWVAPILGMLLGMHLYEALRSASAPSVPRTVTGVEGPL